MVDPYRGAFSSDPKLRTAAQSLDEPASRGCLACREVMQWFSRCESASWSAGGRFIFPWKEVCTMPYFTRDGVRLYYEDHGQGTPILLTHGFAAATGMWRPQIEAF